jgi:hypothetical protein
MNNNYVKSAFRTAVFSGNRYAQLMPSTKRKEPAHNHPNVRTESAYRDLETNRICVGQENNFRNESGYNFWESGPTKNNKDALINQIHKSLVEDSKLSGCDVASRIDLLKIYECIEHELVIKRQSKIPSTAKPLC